MRKARKLSSLLVIALAAIAAAVAVGMLAGLSMWPVIILYWSVLTVKNLLDWLGREAER